MRALCATTKGTKTKSGNRQTDHEINLFVRDIKTSRLLRFRTLWRIRAIPRQRILEGSLLVFLGYFEQLCPRLRAADIGQLIFKDSEARVLAAAVDDQPQFRRNPTLSATIIESGQPCGEARSGHTNSCDRALPERFLTRSIHSLDIVGSHKEHEEAPHRLEKHEPVEATVANHHLGQSTRNWRTDGSC